MRALVLFGRGGERVARDAVSYLLSQQRPDGAFGYFARDEEGPEFVAAHVVLTAACAWALADFASARTHAE